MKKLLAVVIFIILTSMANAVYAPAENVVVVATISPLAAIAREIGGDRVIVHYLVPPGSDPHQYALKPEDFNLVRNCDIFISIGKEAFLGSLPENPGKIRLSWNDWLEAGIYIKNGNPHYLWLYPENAIKVAEKIYEALISIDPAWRLYYTERLEKFKADIENLVRWIDEYTTIANVKGEKVVLAGAHFVPLAEAMGLKVVGVLIRGEGKTPSPLEIAEIEKRIKEENVKVVIVLATQKIGDEGRIASILSRETGVALVYLYGSMFSGNDSYIEYIKYTVTSIVSAIEAAKSKSSSETQFLQFSQTTLLASVVILFLLSIIETAILVKGR
ncbi:MAG: hypothetical protein DRJ38_00880 [Thermoprotei archaeon]|nr:MAG: hypothetical protein DRJ38_00880 [Thermoprotei archaeon]